MEQLRDAKLSVAIELIPAVLVSIAQGVLGAYLPIDIRILRYKSNLKRHCN